MKTNVQFIQNSCTEEEAIRKAGFRSPNFSDYMQKLRHDLIYIIWLDIKTSPASIRPWSYEDVNNSQ